MEQIFTFWPTCAALAREIGESPITVRHWKRRGMIPPKYDRSIALAAEKQGKRLSLGEIAEIRAQTFDEMKERS